MSLFHFNVIIGHTKQNTHFLLTGIPYAFRKQLYFPQTLPDSQLRQNLFCI